MSVLPVNEPDFYSVAHLLASDGYIIPLYQRNYAWKDTEILPLLNDIWERFDADGESRYYLGTLVVYYQKNGLLEIIDGQQRHTTLTLINAVIRARFAGFYDAGADRSNLKFEARVESESLIARFFADYHKAFNTYYPQKSQQNIQNAVKDIQRYLLEKSTEPKFRAYLSYFYDQTQSVRVAVPDGTDINHYFEVMNSRGVQLELHEILKAAFLQKLHEAQAAPRLSERFAAIWESCSQMDSYIQLCFESEERAALFGQRLEKIPVNTLTFEARQGTTSDNSPTLVWLLENADSALTKTGTTTEIVSKYRSVIDFPGFLLQVLSMRKADTPLDDQRLLSSFGYNQQAGKHLPNPIEFINDLLFYRTCFDRYVIKRETESEEWNWKIRQPKKGEELTYENTFDDFRKTAMIQSMMHVSATAGNYKYWLQDCLRYFRDKPYPNKDDFYGAMETTSRRLLGPVNRQELLEGKHRRAYVFNYLDHALYRLYKRGLNGELITDPVLLKVILQINKDKFSKFRFTQNNSVEHVGAQNPSDGSTQVELVNHFGNLCLISRENNSRLSNYGFGNKKDYLKKLSEARVESLKQTLIFDNNTVWGNAEIERHGEQMVAVLMETLVHSN